MTCENASVVLEGLELRTHLAAAPLTAYFPMVAGAKWTFDVVDKGAHTTRTTEVHTIGTKLKRIHGEMAFVRTERSSDGDSSVTLSNVNSLGQIQFHKMGDVTFTPPLVFPKLAKPGQSTHMEGRVDTVMGAFHPRGNYSADIRVVKMERLRVPAGMFSRIP